MGGQFSGTNPDILPATGSQQSASPDPDNHNIQYLYAIIPKQLMTGHFKTSTAKFLWAAQAEN